MSRADEVDRILAAWQRELPELDASPMAVLSRVSRLARHLDLARRSAFANHGLEVWEFDVLSALRRSGPPHHLTPGQLLRQTLVTSGTMTNRVDRLVHRGFVQRQRSESDRRGVWVRLTAGGRTVADAALADLLVIERAMLADLSEQDRSRLADVLRTLVLPFEEEK